MNITSNITDSYNISIARFGDSKKLQDRIAELEAELEAERVERAKTQDALKEYRDMIAMIKAAIIPTIGEEIDRPEIIEPENQDDQPKRRKSPSYAKIKNALMGEAGVYLTTSQIMDETGLSRSIVLRNLHILESEGLVENGGPIGSQHDDIVEHPNEHEWRIVTSDQPPPRTPNKTDDDQEWEPDNSVAQVMIDGDERGAIFAIASSWSRYHRGKYEVCRDEIMVRYQLSTFDDETQRWVEANPADVPHKIATQWRLYEGYEQAIDDIYPSFRYEIEEEIAAEEERINKLGQDNGSEVVPSEDELIEFGKYHAKRRKKGEMLNTEFASIIYQLMHDHGWNQKRIAREFGISTGTASNIRCGKYHHGR